MTAAGSAPDLQADDDLRVQVGPQGEQPVGLHPRDPPVVLERAHDPGDPEAHLAAVGDLRGEHLPGRSPSASAIPTPTSTSFGAPIRRPSASGGASNSVWSPK